VTAKEKIHHIIKALKDSYPDALCQLRYEKDYELLFAVRLSAQCTDERVNMVAPVLFAAYPSLEALAGADTEDLERIVHSCGFYRAKARDIQAASAMLLESYGGKVPDTMEELLKLPGVGRKTANLILGDLYNKPGAIVVDTHCIRITNLLGLVHTKIPEKIEAELRELLPPEESNDFCHRIVLHGRAVCVANRPACGSSSLAPFCAHHTGA